MANVDSTQYANSTAVPISLAKPNELGGRVRIAYFSYTTPSAGLTNGDVIRATTLPKGARIIEGRLAWEALGASTTLSVGYTGSATRYLGATSSATAGGTHIANTVALNYGEELSSSTVINITLGGANTSASALTIRGDIKYAID